MQPVQLPVVESCFCIFFIAVYNRSYSKFGTLHVQKRCSLIETENTLVRTKNDRNKIKRPDTLPLRVGFHLISLILNVVTYNEIHLNNNEHSKY